MDVINNDIQLQSSNLNNVCIKKLFIGGKQIFVGEFNNQSHFVIDANNNLCSEDKMITSEITVRNGDVISSECTARRLWNQIQALLMENKQFTEDNKQLSDNNQQFSEDNQQLSKDNQQLSEDNVQLSEENYQVNQNLTELEFQLGQCFAQQLETEMIRSTGNIVISTMSHTENARTVNLCIGMSTQFGYFSSRSCCDNDKVSLFDIQSNAEITIEENSLSVEENICFINTTIIDKIFFPGSNIAETQKCSILTFDTSEGQFENQQFELNIHDCLTSPCLFDIASYNLGNSTILNGTSVHCENSGHFGIITKSEYFRFSKKESIAFYFQGLNDSQAIEMIIVSAMNFEKLELFKKEYVEVQEQSYENVVGFDSLRKI